MSCGRRSPRLYGSRGRSATIYCPPRAITTSVWSSDWPTASRRCCPAPSGNGWPQIRQKLAAASVALTSGQKTLFQGTVKLYDGAGRLTFHVSDVYPEFTLGQIEAQRRAVLARLMREN